MSTTTVRISKGTLQTLREMATQAEEPMQATLEKAIEAYRRQRFLEGLSADFAALRERPEAWREEMAEREEWDLTIGDGLTDD